MADKAPPGGAGNAGPSRRGFLKIMGTAAAAAGATQLPTAAAAAEAGAVGAPLDLDVVDYVDRTYVLAARAGAQRAGVAGGPGALRLRDGLRIELTSGRAEVREDRYTGRILVKPAAGETVTARAVVPARTTAAQMASAGAETMASLDRSIGYDASDIPTEELDYNSAGGGVCATSLSGDGVQSFSASMTQHLAAERRDAIRSAAGNVQRSTLLVRAGVMGNVIPHSPEHREIRWRHARYYGNEKMLGLLRFTYQPDRVSAVTMNSKGSSFFPATGFNELYCRLEMLDVGGAAFNVEPMHFPGPSITWPAYSTPMRMARPVAYYDEADPDRVVMTIDVSEMKLYDYNGVTIKLAGWKLGADGVLRAGFKVTNQTDAPFVGRWILLGDHADSAFAGSDRPLGLGPSGSRSASRTIDVQVPVRKSELSQRVALTVMSLSDPPVLGIRPITFKYPRA